jgi:adenylate kinase
MNIVIFGPQGSGKGTQADLASKRLKIPHISTGDIFREHMKKGTELGKSIATLMNQGQLVPDEITNEIVKERLSRQDCKKGFILDGYPRNINQARFLEGIKKIDLVIVLNVSDKETIKRISNRRLCPKCGANFNLVSLKPKIDNICDICGTELVQRKDDTPRAVKKRLKIYHQQTTPIFEFYEKRGVLKKINGEPPIKAVADDIARLLRKWQSLMSSS